MTATASRRLGLGGLLARGLRKRCPICGAGRLFPRWFRMVEECPGCGTHFEREEGYWLGAMIVNIAVAELSFVAVFVGGMLLTWPDVPWTALTVVCVVTNIAVPLLFYPWSKTVWVALDVGILQRMEPGVDREDRDRRNAV